MMEGIVSMDQKPDPVEDAAAYGRGFEMKRSLRSLPIQAILSRSAQLLSLIAERTRQCPISLQHLLATVLYRSEMSGHAAIWTTVTSSGWREAQLATLFCLYWDWMHRAEFQGLHFPAETQTSSCCSMFYSDIPCFVSKGEFKLKVFFLFW